MAFDDDALITFRAQDETGPAVAELIRNMERIQRQGRQVNTLTDKAFREGSAKSMAAAAKATQTLLIDSDKLGNKINTTFKQSGVNAEVARVMLERWNRVNRDSARGQKDVSQSMDAVSVSLASVAGRYLTAAGAIALVQKALFSYASLDTKLRRMEIQSGATRAELDALVPTLRKLAAETATSLNEQLDGFEELRERTGLSVAEVEKFYAIVAKGAAGMGVPAQQMAEVFGTLMLNFKIQGKDAQQVMDLFALSTEKLNINMQKLVPMMPRLTATMAGWGSEGITGLKEMLAVVSQLIPTFGSSEVAAQKLDLLFNRLADPDLATKLGSTPEKLNKALHAAARNGDSVLGVFVAMVQEAMNRGYYLEDMFKKTELPTVRAILNIEGVQERIKALGNAAGASARQQELALKGPEAEWGRLKGEVNSLVTELGSLASKIDTAFGGDRASLIGLFTDRLRELNVLLAKKWDLKNLYDITNQIGKLTPLGLVSQGIYDRLGIKPPAPGQPFFTQTPHSSAPSAPARPVPIPQGGVTGQRPVPIPQGRTTLPSPIDPFADRFGFPAADGETLQPQKMSWKNDVSAFAKGGLLGVAEEHGYKPPGPLKKGLSLLRSEDASDAMGLATPGMVTPAVARSIKSLDMVLSFAHGLLRRKEDIEAVARELLGAATGEKGGLIFRPGIGPGAKEATTEFSSIRREQTQEATVKQLDELNANLRRLLGPEGKMIRASLTTGDGGGAGPGGDGGGGGPTFRRGIGPGSALRRGGGEGSGGPYPPSGGRIGKAQQSKNSDAIMDELRKAGVPDEGIAAVMGSMQSESSFDPTAGNSKRGGHTGLWQWDSTRWPKIARWIQKQGGNIWDPRWQTRAWVAEHQAKPGDPLYDTGRTQRGGAAIWGSKGNLGKALWGIQESERYGRGEEAGRFGHARAWLPHVIRRGQAGAGWDVPTPRSRPINPETTYNDLQGRLLEPDPSIGGRPRGHGWARPEGRNEPAPSQWEGGRLPKPGEIRGLEFKPDLGQGRSPEYYKFRKEVPVSRGAEAPDVSQQYEQLLEMRRKLEEPLMLQTRVDPGYTQFARSTGEAAFEGEHRRASARKYSDTMIA